MAFDTQHAEWVTVSLFLFNTGFFLFYHTQTVSSDIDPAYLSLLIFFLFSDTLTPLLPLSCLSHSDQICSFRSWGGGEWNIQKPLHL